MADVSRPADRGQLILATGLVLAVGLVALVLLLNTAIYSQHLASRGLPADGTEALSHRDAVADGVGGVIVAENAAGYADRSNVEENVTAGTDRVASLLRESTIRRGAWGNASREGLSAGNLLRQTDPSRELTSAGGAANWTLATDVNDTRRFRLAIQSGLTSTLLLTTEAYTVRLVGDGGNVWAVYVYKDTTGTLKLGVKNGSDSSPTQDVCSPPSSAPFRVDLTAGTVNGTRCTAIQFAKGIDAPYDVEYDRGGNAKGTYNLTVNTTGGASVQGANFNGAGGASPQSLPAVYSVEMTVEYDAAGVRYTAPLRVAPGEPDA